MGLGGTVVLAIVGGIFVLQVVPFFLGGAGIAFINSRRGRFA